MFADWWKVLKFSKTKVFFKYLVVSEMLWLLFNPFAFITKFRNKNILSSFSTTSYETVTMVSTMVTVPTRSNSYAN